MTDSPFRLLQVSDCHLSADEQRSYRGQNADANLSALIVSARMWEPQLVLVTGDLSEDASAVSYQRLVNHFDRFKVSVCALPGNHDDVTTMQRHFPAGPWQGPRTVVARGWRIVMLDSTVPGRIDGALAEADFTQLERILQGSPHQPVLLALHHQPVPVNSPWIDPYRLQAPEALLELVQRHEVVRGVVWGHVHQAFESVLGSARLMSCPSSAANTRAGSSRFEEDPAGPAARWIELYPNGELKSGLLYASGRIPG